MTTIRDIVIRKIVDSERIAKLNELIWIEEEI